MADEKPAAAVRDGETTAQQADAAKRTALEPASPSTDCAAASRSPYLRPANEDDDGYDPYSDRRPEPEPLFERDPWR